MTEDVDKYKKSRETKGKPNVYAEGWLTITQKLCTMMAGFTVTVDMRVALAICAHADYHNGLLVTQADIAAELKVARATVNRSFSRLRKLQVIERVSRASEPTAYRLNPDYAWRGSGKAHQKALWQKEADKARAIKEAREADNLARLRVARMKFLASHPEASKSRRRTAKSGYKGVTAHNGGWLAQIQIRCQRYNLGTHATPELAHAAYLKAKKELSIHKPKD